MSYDVISYILIGSIFTAIMVPLIALLRRSIREKKSLDEVRHEKKLKTPQSHETLAYD